MRSRPELLRDAAEFLRCWRDGSGPLTEDLVQLTNELVGEIGASLTEMDEDLLAMASQNLRPRRTSKPAKTVGRRGRRRGLS